MAYVPYFACAAYILRQKMAYVDFGHNLYGGVAQIALFAKFTPLYLEKIYLQISILKTNFASTFFIKTKARNISSGPVPDSVIFKN